MVNKLTKRKYYMAFNENNSKDCGRPSGKARGEYIIIEGLKHR
jgi:hypothetical protein